MSVARIVQTSVTLAAATPSGQIVASSNARVSLTIQNTGTGSASIGFGAAATAGAGLSLDPASAAGGQGGSRVWDGSDRIPSDAIHAISTAGTTLVIIEGFAGP